MKIEDSVRELLKSLSMDLSTDGLKETPRRVERMWRDITSGYRIQPDKLVEGAIFKVDYDEMVLMKDIEFYSMCEHHLLPFFGKVHIAYIPDGRIIGLSKLPRIVDTFSRRLQVQEKLTIEIANFLNKILSPKGTACVVDGFHLCVAMRGVEKKEARVITSSMLGIFRTDSKTRSEFLNLIK